jgi:hypothetical protein
LLYTEKQNQEQIMCICKKRGKNTDPSLKAVNYKTTLGITVHCERLLAVSNVCEAAAATAPEKPAATLEAKGCTGPASSKFLRGAKG